MPSDSSAMLKVMLGKADISQQVVRVDIEDVDRGADKATFVMDDPGATNSDGIEENMDVRIELGWESEYALAFVGRVRSVRSLANSGGKHRVEATCLDLSSRFMKPPPIEGRQHVGPLDKILADIAKDTGVPVGAVTVDPMPTWTEDKPLDQLNRTAWQMIQDIAEEYHARAFVEVNAAPKDSEAVKAAGGEPKLYFASLQSLLDQAPMGELSYCRGMGSLLDYQLTRMGSGASPVASAAVANPDDAAAVDSFDLPPTAPDVQPAPSASKIDRTAAVRGEAAAADYAAARQNAADAEALPAEQRAQRHVAGTPSDAPLVKRLIQQDQTRKLGYRLVGTAMGTVFLRAKGSVTIDGLPSMTTGRWYVSRVNHIVERGTLIEREDVDARARAARQKRLTFRSKLVATR